MLALRPVKRTNEGTIRELDRRPYDAVWASIQHSRDPRFRSLIPISYLRMYLHVCVSNILFYPFNDSRESTFFVCLFLSLYQTLLTSFAILGGQRKKNVPEVLNVHMNEVYIKLTTVKSNNYKFEKIF